jgi:hypothetical protein
MHNLISVFVGVTFVNEIRGLPFYLVEKKEERDEGEEEEKADRNDAVFVAEKHIV